MIWEKDFGVIPTFRMSRVKVGGIVLVTILLIWAILQLSAWWLKFLLIIPLLLISAVISLFTLLNDLQPLILMNIYQISVYEDHKTYLNLLWEDIRCFRKVVHRGKVYLGIELHDAQQCYNSSPHAYTPKRIARNQKRKAEGMADLNIPMRWSEYTIEEILRVMWEYYPEHHDKIRMDSL